MQTKSGLWPRLFLWTKAKRLKQYKLQPFESRLFEGAGNGRF